MLRITSGAKVSRYEVHQLLGFGNAGERVCFPTTEREIFFKSANQRLAKVMGMLRFSPLCRIRLYLCMSLDREKKKKVKKGHDKLANFYALIYSHFLL